MEKALYQSIGRTPSELERRTYPLKNEYVKRPGLVHFLKAKYDQQGVEILTAQSSAMLSSFASANCLAILPMNEETWNEGDQIETIILP